MKQTLLAAALGLARELPESHAVPQFDMFYRDMHALSTRNPPPPFQAPPALSLDLGQQANRMMDDEARILLYGWPRWANGISDLHTTRAAKMYGIPEDQVTPEQRKHAKQIAYLEMYTPGPLMPLKSHDDEVRDDLERAQFDVDQIPDYDE